MIDAHKKQWNFLKEKFESKNISHGYLFSGQAGIGKKAFAKELVKFINCLTAQAGIEKNKPCGECQNCRFIEQETFPDLLIVKSENSKSSLKDEVDKHEIDVMQIRAAQNFLSYKAYYGKYKIVIIFDAERMNTEAQNCFLKTLEEPKGNTVIILISSKPDMLLPTIFSRCQTIKFFATEKYEPTKLEQSILQELLPIITGELAVKFQYAKRVNLEGDRLVLILETLQRYFRNVMLVKLGVIKESIMPSHLNYSVKKLQQIIILIENLAKQAVSTNANAKLALEILLMEI